MSTTQRRLLIILKALRNNVVRDPSNPELNSICCSVMYAVGAVGKNDYNVLRDVLEELFPRWPEYSGVKHYPVPAPDGRSPQLEFFDCVVDQLWVGEYGAARLRLLDWLISELQSVVNLSK